MGVYCESCAMKIEQGDSKNSFVAISVERLQALSEKAGGMGEGEATLAVLRKRAINKAPDGVKLG